MKKSAYDYICSHPGASVHDIASAIDTPEIEVLDIVNTLTKKEFIALSQIVPLGPENPDSCRYSATGKRYSGDYIQVCRDYMKISI